MDEVKDKEVFVLATANNIDNLPKSLLRVGRFDKVIEVRNPKGQDAIDIIKHYLSKIKFVDEVDAEYIAKVMNGRSCAELETVINGAGVYAGFSGKEKIDMDDIIKSCMRIIFNAPEMIDATDEDLELTAYHEAGHTVVAEVLEPDSVNIVSVLKYGGDIGGIKKRIIYISVMEKEEIEQKQEKKYDNQYLYESQLETLKLFYERNLFTKEQYEFEVKTLTEKIKR